MLDKMKKAVVDYRPSLRVRWILLAMGFAIYLYCTGAVGVSFSIWSLLFLWLGWSNVASALVGDNFLKYIVGAVVPLSMTALSLFFFFRARSATFWMIACAGLAAVVVIGALAMPSIAI